MAKISPTQNTLKKLRSEGWLVAVVEKWNPHANIRQDLFGFIDLLAVRGTETLAIQATSDPNVSSRVKKIKSEKLLLHFNAVREAGWQVEVWGWKKVKNRWEVRIVEVI